MQIRLYIIVLLSTVFVPITFFIFFKTFFSKNTEESIKLLKLIHIATVFVFNFLTFFLLKRVGGIIHNFIFLIFLQASIIIFIIFVISIWKKINISMFAISCLTGYVTALSFIFSIDLIWFLTASLIVSGLIGYSQLSLKKNTQIQIYTSYTIGFFSSIIVIIILNLNF